MQQKLNRYARKEATFSLKIRSLSNPFLSFLLKQLQSAQLFGDMYLDLSAHTDTPSKNGCKKGASLHGIEIQEKKVQQSLLRSQQNLRQDAKAHGGSQQKTPYCPQWEQEQAQSQDLVLSKLKKREVTLRCPSEGLKKKRRRSNLSTLKTKQEQSQAQALLV